MKLFVFFLFIYSCLATHAAELCDECAPLTEVSITNAGLEKMLSRSIDENLKRLDTALLQRGNFKNIKLDKSNCRTRTVSQAWKERNTDNCYGLPQFDNDPAIGGSTLLRPFTAEIENFKLDKVDLQLAGPVKCKNFVCDFDIKANAIEISGNMKVDYTDKNEVFVPSTPIKLKSTPNADLRLHGQAYIDPKSASINDLVHVKEDQTRFTMSPGSIHIDLGIKTEFASKDEEIRLKAKSFHQYVPVAKITPQYIEQQYNAAIMRFEVQLRSEIEKQRKAEGKPELTFKQLIEASEKEAQARINEVYGSVDKFKATLGEIKWPAKGDDKATYEFMQNPPKELGLFTEMTDKIQFAKIAAVGENSGFQNGSAFYYTMIATDLANKAAALDLGMDQFIKPMVEQQVLPKVHAEVNKELSNLKKYWNQISKIPNLNAQNLQIMSDLREKLKTATTAEEKARIQNEIDTLKYKMDSDWVSIDTEVAVDQTLRDGKLLRAQISKSNPSCSSVPKRFSDDLDTDFDVRTEFGVNTLQEYFNRMAQNKNLDLCIDSEEPASCRGGTKVQLKHPPKISCVDGDFLFELNAEASKSIFNVDVQGSVKAKVSTCSGSPCIQFTDAQGKFKNVFVNTFFGQMLDRGISTAMAKNGQLPIRSPAVALKKSQTSPQTCSTKLDWAFEEPSHKP